MHRAYKYNCIRETFLLEFGLKKRSHFKTGRVIIENGNGWYFALYGETEMLPYAKGERNLFSFLPIFLMLERRSVYFLLKPVLKKKK